MNDIIVLCTGFWHVLSLPFQLSNILFSIHSNALETKQTGKLVWLSTQNNNVRLFALMDYGIMDGKSITNIQERNFPNT